MALAIAHHDLGLWIEGGALDYLELSAKSMERELGKDASGALAPSFERIPQLDETSIATAREIIFQHHKYRAWFPEEPEHEILDDFAHTDGVKRHAILVNAVRMADWADVTLGLVRFWLPDTHLEAAYQALPEAGFHRMLLNAPSRLSPHSILGRFPFQDFQVVATTMDREQTAFFICFKSCVSASIRKTL